MPRYEYECIKCGRFEIIVGMKEMEREVTCIHCNRRKAHLIPSLCALQTDSNFVGTGEYDNRVCANRNDKIEGRKDWNKRLNKKNLRELDRAEVTKNPPKPVPCM
jgi:putative FmdB family regulatory protein